jgi:sortase (surface protein transpeptidase)
MTRSRSPRGAWVIVVALLAVACSGGADRSAAGVQGTPAAPGASAEADAHHGSHHDHDDHDHGDHDHDQHDHHETHDHHLDDDAHEDHLGEAEASGLTGPLTTEETLARFATIDPARLARAHDHDHHDHGHREVSHPNGIDPHRIVIPAIGVDADVIDLGVNANGTMEVPTDFAQTGWFTPGPRPGRVGPAVIAGHVDSRDGPAVFFRLTELEAGDLIEVHSDDGEVVTFEVRELEQHPKDAFPTERVYSGTPGPELRLITCGGVFDHAERSYRDNIIVYAERVDA